jgi:hypothetical protein
LDLIYYQVVFVKPVINLVNNSTFFSGLQLFNEFRDTRKLIDYWLGMRVFGTAG